MFGLRETKKEYGGKAEAEDVIKYIENVEDFKHCEDEIRAGRLLELHNLTLDHVPGHLLKSEEVRRIKRKTVKGELKREEK